MLRFLFVLFSTTLSFSSVAEIYQHQDAEGNIVFSDKPVEGSIKRKISEPTVIKFETKVSSENAQESASEKTNEPVNELAKAYTQIKITQPQDQATVKQDAGVVSISFNIEPPLQTKFGHYLVLTLDGRKLEQKYSSPSITLSNLERGSHSISAEIKDNTGMSLINSPQVSFFLHRFSKKFN